MNIWSKQGLDLGDSTFVKKFESATRFTEKDDNGEPIRKFELYELERSGKLRNLFVSKISKLGIKTIMKVKQSGEDFRLLDQSQLAIDVTIIADPSTANSQEKNDRSYDARIKSNAIGLWI